MRTSSKPLHSGKTTGKLIARLVVAIILLAATPRTCAEAPLEDLRQALGPRGALIVHVGAGTGEAAMTLAQAGPYLVHGLEPDAVKAAQAQERAHKAGLHGRVWVEQARVDVLPHVKHLANAIVVDEFPRVAQGGLTARELLRVLAPTGWALVGGADAQADRLKAWLAAGGVQDARFIGKDGVYAFWQKPRPPDMDEWTHKWRDATRNSASQDKHLSVPNTLNWINSEAYTWSMRHYRTSGNRVVLIFDNTGGLSRWGHRKEDSLTIETYDAYSGVTLWKKKFTPTLKCGPQPIVTGELIVTPVGDQVQLLSAANGEVIKTLTEAGKPADGVVSDGVLVTLWAGGIRAVELPGGKLLWQSQPDFEVRRSARKGDAGTGWSSYCPVAADGMVFVIERRPKDGSQEIVTRVVGLDLRTGKETWACADAELRDLNERYFYYNGRLVVNGKSAFFALPVKSLDRQVWKMPVTVLDNSGLKQPTGALAGHASKSALGVNSAIWIREGSQFRLLLGEKPDLAELLPPKRWVAYDAQTGQEKTRVGYESPSPVFTADFETLRPHLVAGPVAEPLREELARHNIRLVEGKTKPTLKVIVEGVRWYLTGEASGAAGQTTKVELTLKKADKELWFWRPQSWQQRCYPDLAAPAFILSSNNELVNLATGEITNYRAVRGQCGEGPFFGNGLTYLSTHWCAFCYPMIRGATAMSGEAPPPTPVQERFEKGPAYVETAAAQPAAPDEWPEYRGNSYRTNGTTAAIPMPLAGTPIWKKDFGERILPPVVAGGRACVTIVNQGRIVALEAESGKEVWSVVAGPRIDLPPTLHAGQLLFGSHDGCVYALRASDGALAWRFHAAPEKRRMSVCDRVESSWPLMGSVLVRDGTAFVLAGRVTQADGGMHMYALDAVNGKMKWHHVLSGSLDPRLATGIPCWKQLEGQMTNSLLVGHRDQIHLYDQHFVWRFRAADGEQIVPEKNSNFDFRCYCDDTPWVGYDRVTSEYLIHGQDPVIECQFHYSTGTPVCFPDPKSVGLVAKRMRAQRHFILYPAAARELAASWEAPEKGAFDFRWQPQKTFVDVHALLAAGDTVFFAGPAFDPVGPEADLQCVSLKDGRITPILKLPCTPPQDGMSAAKGRLYVALRNGTLLCLGRSR